MHQFSGLGVEAILKNSLMRQSLDNVTVVMVAFENFKKTLCSGSSTVIPPTPPVIHRNISNDNKFQDSANAEKENINSQQQSDSIRGQRKTSLAQVKHASPGTGKITSSPSASAVLLPSTKLNSREKKRHSEHIG